MHPVATSALASILLFSAAAVVATGAAAAEVKIRFDEGAPKDRFSITNMSACNFGPLKIKIDLAPSPYGLIFDVSASGAGVEVFQPLEIVQGRQNLASIPTIRDGDNAITLQLLKLDASQTVSFTIDIDDTVEARGITVADGEIAKARVELSQGDFTSGSDFGGNAIALVRAPDCAA